MDKTTALEDLSYIKKIISDSKQTAVDNGFGFIIWGILISIALLFNYYAIVTELHGWTFYIWIAAVGIGWLITFYDNSKHKKKRVPSTYAGKILGSVWMSLGVVMTIIGFGATTLGALKGVYITSFISLQIGIGFIVTGTVYSNKVMMFLGLAWWLGALVMMGWPGVHVLLIMAFMMIFLQVVPGIIIYRKYLAEKINNQ